LSETHQEIKERQGVLTKGGGWTGGRKRATRIAGTGYPAIEKGGEGDDKSESGRKTFIEKGQHGVNTERNRVSIDTDWSCISALAREES